jgi:hypothetical protein
MAQISQRQIPRSILDRMKDGRNEQDSPPTREGDD